jgi:hypothetical protein
MPIAPWAAAAATKRQMPARSSRTVKSSVRPPTISSRSAAAPPSCRLEPVRRPLDPGWPPDVTRTTSTSASAAAARSTRLSRPLIGLSRIFPAVSPDSSIVAICGGHYRMPRPGLSGLPSLLPIKRNQRSRRAPVLKSRIISRDMLAEETSKSPRVEVEGLAALGGIGELLVDGEDSVNQCRQALRLKI